MNAPLTHPLPVQTQVRSPLAALVALEGQLLAAGSRTELRHATLAGASSVIPFGMAAWVTRHGRRAKLRAVSGIGKADRNTPFAQWLERELRPHLASTEAKTFELNGASEHTPYQYALLAPFPDGGGALLFLRDTAFPEHSPPTAARVAQLAGLCAGARRARPAKARGKVLPLVALALVGLAAVPVPMTTLAPMEIVPSAPFHVTAPFDGVLQDVVVEPYARVREGDVLARLEPTQYSNEAELADREERLARARARRADLASFSNPAAKADMAIARAEAELAAARKAYALDNLSRTTLTAQRDGIAIVDRVAEWRGRPVATGESILELADPDAREIKLLIPLDSGEALEAGRKVRVFLDSDPAHPVEAVLSRSALRATAQPDGSMAFEAHAAFDGEPPLSARLGARSVAKLYGERAPLIWWFARKPVTALRQLTGF